MPKLNLWKFIVALTIFVASATLCQQVIWKSALNQNNKQDAAEINDIRYGLFSVNMWKERLAAIIVEEIDKLSLTRTNATQLKAHVEIQLNGLIDNVDKKIRESNKGTTKGWIKQAFINAFVSIKDIKKGIPEYADAIIVEMTKAQTEHHLKNIVNKRIEKYFDKTFEIQDLSRLDQIVSRIGAADIESAKVRLSQEIEKNQRIINQETCLLIALAILLFVLLGVTKKMLSGPGFILMLLELGLLLLAGVTTPMIDMEAKISQITLVLLDHPITFVNQVLYFQTKSILDVFWIMITNSEMQMKFVGILMVCFSVVFPVLKMISAFAYYYDFHKARENSLVRFFVLKSGKWSMSDVLVVAIFMAYIGFNGIITSQFGNMNSADQDLVILTTNGTSLQPGFYIFMSYAVLALFLSGLLVKKRAPDQ